MIPFHKQTNASKQAGQRVFPLPIKELTLSDYIARKTDEPKKITFYEWFSINSKEIEVELESGYINAKWIWESALKQGKL